MELPANLSKNLTRIRRQEYGERSSYKACGVVNISYPIFDERGSALYALTIPYIQHYETNTTADKVRSALRQTASEITAAIGGRLPRA